jgi:hypothetical protein
MGDVMEFELHFATDTAVGPRAEALSEGIHDLGFTDDRLITHGVVFADGVACDMCPLAGLHVSWSTYDRSEYKSKLAAFRDLMAGRDDCAGYAHGEVIKPEWDVDFALMPFSSSVRYPAKRFEISRGGKAKLWDIHISAKLDTLDRGLERVLFDQAGMYYIDLQKRSGVHRIFTIQGSNSLASGLSLYHALQDYLANAGGMQGSMKFEQTCYWEVFGDCAIIPPTTEEVRLLVGAEA